jgi:hypothetical protein
MAIVFWDMNGVILIDVMVKEAAKNVEAYAATLETQELNAASSSIKKADVLLHDNTRPQFLKARYPPTWSSEKCHSVTKVWG